MKLKVKDGLLVQAQAATLFLQPRLGELIKDTYNWASYG
jgi:hypothetical protein